METQMTEQAQTNASNEAPELSSTWRRLYTFLRYDSDDLSIGRMREILAAIAADDEFWRNVEELRACQRLNDAADKRLRTAFERAGGGAF